MGLCFTLCGTWAMLHARSRDRIRKNGKISGFGARAEAEGLDCRARRSWLDRLVGQPGRRGLSNLWYGAQFPARLICPAASGLAGARDVGLDPGHAKGRRLAPGATLHMSQNGMWGDRHAQAGQRPSSTQSKAEPGKIQRPYSAALCKTARLIRGFWPLSTRLPVMRCDVVSEQLPSKVELSGATTFGASDALASNDICREASIINFTRATASTAGNLLDDR
jgi:hypothetical protein